MAGGRRLVQQPLFIGRRDTSGPKELTGPEYWSKWVGMRWDWKIVSRSFMGTKAFTTIESISAPLPGNMCQVTYKTVINTEVRSSLHPTIVTGFTLGLIAKGPQEWRLPPDYIYSDPLSPEFPSSSQWAWTGPSTSGVCAFLTTATPTATVSSDSTSPTFSYNYLRALTFSGGTLPTQNGDHVFTVTTTRLKALNPL